MPRSPATRSTPAITDAVHPLQRPWGTRRLDVAGSMRARVAEARTLRGEIEALVADLPPRNAALVRARWGLDGVPVPPLRTLAGQHGLTTFQRVRQIVVEHERRVAAAAPRLRIARQVAALVRSPVSMARLQERAAARGLAVAPEELFVLPTLGRMGLIRPLTYSARTEMFATAPTAALRAD